MAIPDDAGAFGDLELLTIAAMVAAANTTGGVMRKMVSPQSIVIASTTTNRHGHEGDILHEFFDSGRSFCETIEAGGHR